jgi:hypothetical protein
MFWHINTGRFYHHNHSSHLSPLKFIPRLSFVLRFWLFAAISAMASTKHNLKGRSSKLLVPLSNAASTGAESVTLSTPLPIVPEVPLGEQNNQCGFCFFVWLRI